MIASAIKEGYSWVLLQNTELTFTSYWHCSVFSNWFWNLKLNVFCGKTGNVWFFVYLHGSGERGRENAQNCHNYTAFVCWIVIINISGCFPFGHNLSAGACCACVTSKEERILNQISACLSREKMKRRGKAKRDKDYQPRILNDTSKQHIKAFHDNCPLSRNESLDI